MTLSAYSPAASRFGYRAIADVGGSYLTRVRGTLDIYTDDGQYVTTKNFLAAPDRHPELARFEDTPQIVDNLYRQIKKGILEPDTQDKLKKLGAGEEEFRLLAMGHPGVLNPAKNHLLFWDNGKMKNADYQEGLEKRIQNDPDLKPAKDFKLLFLNDMPVQVVRAMTSLAKKLEGYRQQLFDPTTYSAMFLGKPGGGLGSGQAIRTPGGKITIVPSEVQHRKTNIKPPDQDPVRVIVQNAGPSNRSLIKSFAHHLGLDDFLAEDLSKIQEGKMVTQREFVPTCKDKAKALFDTWLFQVEGEQKQPDGSTLPILKIHAIEEAKFHEAQTKAIKQSAVGMAKLFVSHALAGNEYFTIGGKNVEGMNSVVEASAQTEPERFDGAKDFADLIKQAMLDDDLVSEHGRTQLKKNLHINLVPMEPDGNTLALLEKAELTPKGDLVFDLDDVKAAVASSET